MDGQFDYAEEFGKLDLAALKKDLYALMTDSQDWWPADWGHYGGLFIRMAWHRRRHYLHRRRTRRRPAPATSARADQQLARQRQPGQGAPAAVADQEEVRQADFLGDLMILAGNCALESMGFKTFGFAGGRVDIWEPRRKSTGAPSRNGWATSATAASASWRTRWPPCRWPDLREPGGSDGNPTRLPRAATCARPSPHGDERRRDRRPGGRRPYLRQGARRRRPEAVGPNRKRLPGGNGTGLEERLRLGKGSAPRPAASKAHGSQPDPVGHGYFDMLFGYEWELVKSPAGAWQWLAKDVKPEHMIADAHEPSKKHRPMMTTADLSLPFRSDLRADLAPLPQDRRRSPMPSPAPGSS